ncbi:MAG: hypothetical protein KDA91_20825 [Planctomycetaceae bacterium]|nr:hypothetical protein [Planctomycetaceae bacterium]
MTRWSRLISMFLIAAANCIASVEQVPAAQQAPVETTDSARQPVISDDIQQPIRIRAEVEEIIPLGSGSLRLLLGDVKLSQGSVRIAARKMAVLDDPLTGTHDVHVYAEEASLWHQDLARQKSKSTVRLQSTTAPEVLARSSRTTERSNDPLFERAAEHLFSEQFRPTNQVALQVTPDLYLPDQSRLRSSSGQSGRRVQIRPRSSQPLQIESFESRNTQPLEQVYVITGGVNILIEGIQFDLQGQPVSPGVIDISADRIVAWTHSDGSGQLESGEAILQSSDTRFQVYLEGNIVIRHKQNTVTATHAFFDANNDRALLMNAELRAFLPQTGGYVRVRAERMRQLSSERFHAQNAWATTSPYGVPGYRLQSSDIFVEPGVATPWIGADPSTGQPLMTQSTWITSLNNKVMIGETPVFWLPRISAPAEDPGIPLRQLTVGQDRIFGFQVKTVWDLTKLLGLPKQNGFEWDLLANEMTKRGPGVGTATRYQGTNPWGSYQGEGTIFYQYDHGKDNLGLDRRALEPESDNRGEAALRHRQQIGPGGLLFGEIGYISDRNYLEQYDETRFDTGKDSETILGFRQDLGSYSGTIWGKAELNRFEASTQWLPRADLYSFSQPVFGGLAYWSSHSSAGYADLNPMQLPTDPTDPFTPLGLPYVADASGVVAMSRHEIDAPFSLGPLNLQPYVKGEAAYWEEGFTGNSVDRYLVNAGIRAKLFAWKVMPFVNSRIFNLRGLAHKHESMVEYSWTDVSRGINEIPQYNEIDENSQERFRSRYPLQVFSGVVPGEFNPRNYAIRNGAGLWTSAPYHELVDDQQVIRFSFRNRLQTKAGPPNAERTRDWMVWESGFSVFPESGRDNFGESFGLIYNHYRWNISDRTSLLADSMTDPFRDGQNIWSLGILSQRSTRGSIYLAYRKVDLGKYLDSQILTGSYSYQMSPKWISTASFAYDVAAGESRGSSLTISRVGLDWILHTGVGFDFSKNNVGIGISLEPRFGPPSPTNLGYLLGLQR